MMLFNNKKKQSKYTQIIANAFPGEIFDSSAEIANMLPDINLSFHLSDNDCVFVHGEMLHIPSRIYFDEPHPQLITSLTSTQYSQICCLYTRHHNGFVRQKYTEKCLTLTDYWIPPYILHLLGEYVLEILIMLQQHAGQIVSPTYMEFISENPNFIYLITNRIVSYWDCYYRRQYPDFRDYPGFIIAKQLNLWDYQTIPNIAKGINHSWNGE